MNTQSSVTADYPKWLDDKDYHTHLHTGPMYVCHIGHLMPSGDLSSTCPVCDQKKEKIVRVAERDVRLNKPYTTQYVLETSIPTP